jgi:hypothetical protein
MGEFNAASVVFDILPNVFLSGADASDCAGGQAEYHLSEIRPHPLMISRFSSCLDSAKFGPLQSTRTRRGEGLKSDSLIRALPSFDDDFALRNLLEIGSQFSLIRFGDSRCLWRKHA